MSEVSSILVFYVNGRKIEDNDVDPSWTLLQYLRRKLRLCGTKLGCGEGGCGACTVMVSKFDRGDSSVEHFTVNACLAPVVSMHGLAVTTIEGIGSTRTKLHPVQERIAKAHGSQCGFCTPGIVMSMYTLLRNNPRPSMREMETFFQGNLCRCTGYRPIIEGYKTFTVEGGCCGGINGNGCCKNGVSEDFNEDQEDSYLKLFNEETFTPFDPSQEPIFPPELKLSSKYETVNLRFNRQNITWFRPSSLSQLLELKKKYTNAKLVVGNTEIGVEVKFKKCEYPVIISPTSLQEMTKIVVDESGVTFGAAVTLGKIETTLCSIVDKEPEYKTRVFVAILDMLNLFAGKQIRNVACIAGNIATASPISDLNPLLMACGARLNLASVDEKRTITMDDQFFVSYRRINLRKDEVIVSVVLPFSQKDQFFFGFKQSQRREDDIAIVNAGMSVTFKPLSNVIDSLRMAFGGISATTLMAVRTMNTLQGKLWDNALLTEACDLLASEFVLPANAPGGMVTFRQTLVSSFFFKFYHKVINAIHEGKADVSAYRDFHHDIPKSSQIFQLNELRRTDEVGKPVIAKSAYLQATGEAVYLDDMPIIQGELYLALILSTHAYAKIINVDPLEALVTPGVHGYVGAKDIPLQRNGIGHSPSEYDEEIFASEFVYCQGQIIGGIVGDDLETAQKAARMVRVEYEDMAPLVLTIQDAIEHSSFFNYNKMVDKGDVDIALLQADHVIDGEIHMGGQEHFYLEPQGSIAIPKGEHGEMEILSSTQNPTYTQKMVASALGVDENRVVCKVKRIGGGFGGKETRNVIISSAVAVAAHKYNRPVRCILDRDEDMAITGTRHPFLSKYKVAFTKDGEITGFDVDFYSNAGCSLDLSIGVMDRALLHMDNVYRIPNIRGRGHLCKTNLPSNTAFRGFGGPQGMLVIETALDELSAFLRLDPIKVRELNMHREGDISLTNEVLEGCNIGRCWQECLITSDYDEKRQSVEQFNKVNRWKKRGLAVIPTKFGISFGIQHMNQAGALIHVYTDGSVLLTHSGVEMGQGLNTKMIQVASRALDIEASKIHISEVSTDKVPNTSPSAASVSSDLNGMAVLDACNKIKNRIQPYIDNSPKGCWEEWIEAAYLERVSLSATGFYKIPDIGYDWVAKTGRPFSYFVYGVACSEVEVDCLTGDHKVLTTDIVMDVGNSLNPAIDIGQIEGAFMQGYGLFTIEELRYSPTGFLYTRGPGTYKIPSFGDIPVELNVSLLKNAANLRAVYSSKAIGEPPLFLAASVFFAIKDAISAARLEAGETGVFKLNSPASSEKIRMACLDQFTRRTEDCAVKSSTMKPWSIVV